MDIQADDLVLFARIAECGSFARAAEQSGLPRSSVSRRIAALEESLGERLLVRDTRRLTITDFGQDLLTHARRLHAELLEARQLAASRDGPPRGRLRVSAPPQLAETVLARPLLRFVAEQPEVELTLDVSIRPVDLLAERFDIALRLARQLPDDGLLVARRLCDLHAGLYASPAYLARHAPLTHPTQLEGHACVQYLTQASGALAWRLQRGDEVWSGLPPVRMSSNSMTIVGGAALEGLGIAVLEREMADDLVQRGQLQRVLAAWALPTVALWAVTPGRKLLPARTRALLDLLERALRDGG